MRIIPTYVGSTLLPRHQPPPVPNHSHVCGINFCLTDESSIPAESFPRMWDQHPHPRQPLSGLRIIPTYVGSTRACARRGVSVPNHSHVCGINVVKEHWQDICNESFPRMWDQHVTVSGTAYTARIIPTYVGSTRPGSRRPRCRPNHSHVCGINRDSGYINRYGHESFPRMWDQR